MAKGGEFERAISKKLSRWWSNGERDDIFWRSASSGARATMRSKKGKTTANSNGDLKYLDECGKPFIDLFVIELKRGYTNQIGVLPLLDSNKKNHALYTFWEQVERDRLDANRKFSLVIFKRDRMKECVMMSSVFFNKTERWIGKYPGDAIKFYHNIWLDSQALIILNLDEFLDWFTPEISRKML